MTEVNPRGGLRKLPDVMAIRTKGRKTTYEPRTIAGIGAKVRVRNLKGRI